MKERKITFDRNTDETIVEDKDGTLAKELKEIYDKQVLNLSFCYNQLLEGKLTESMKETHLSLAESYLIEFLEKVDYESVLSRQKENRYAKIKELNEENRKLRGQLGEKVSNEDVRERLKLMYESIQNWWNIYGFGHCSDITFHRRVIQLNLSGMISEAYRSNMDSTEEDKRTYLKGLGFQIDEDDRRVICNDSNLKILNKLLKDRWPNSQISGYSTFETNGIYTFKEITVYIDDFDDVL